jgi:hypothetical protein
MRIKRTIRAGGGRYELIEVGDGAVHKFSVADIPDRELVEEGHQSARGGVAVEAIGFLYESLCLVHCSAEVLQLGADQADLCSGHNPRGLVSGIPDAFVAELEAILAPGGLWYTPLTVACMEGFCRVAEHPLSNSVARY